MKTYLCVLPRGDEKRDIVMVAAADLEELFWTLDEFSDPYGYLIKVAQCGLAISITQDMEIEILNGDEEEELIEEIYWVPAENIEGDGPQMSGQLDFAMSGNGWKRLARKKPISEGFILKSIPLRETEGLGCFSY